MKRLVLNRERATLWPDPWRAALIALCTLILCSCRSPSPSAPHRGLPAEAYTGAPAAMAMAAQGMDQNAPLPYALQGPWAPSGLRQPWPEDEYLRDGGDAGLPAGGSGGGEVQGLEMEDAVAHYETIDGRTLVEPSNVVHLYSPRFGAVRQVVGLMANEERQRAGGVESPQSLDAPTTVQIVSGAKQHIQPNLESAARPLVALRGRQFRDVMSTSLGPTAFQNAFKPYENLSIIRQGVFEASEGMLLARSSESAIAWNSTQAVQIILDRSGAMATVKYDQSQSIYTIEDPPGRPKLRLIKTASTPFAQPGDTVDFTLRFDNIGNQLIGNVTILDSLGTRLEYVPQSAQCSRDAHFSTAPNEGGSEVVRCELSDPLEPGQGGILRFRCRVR